MKGPAAKISTANTLLTEPRDYEGILKENERKCEQRHSLESEQ